MKLFLRFSISIFFLSSALAAYTQPTFLRTPSSLHPLPLVYTGVVPDVYLPGDSVRRTYIATHLLDVSADISAETNLLISKIKERGRVEGVDGIVLRDLGQRVVGPNGGIIALTGIGIKYRDNIDYLDYQLQQRIFSTHHKDGTAAETVIVNYDWRGNFDNAFDKIGQVFYVDSIMPFDLHLAMVLKPEMYEYVFAIDNTLSRIRINKKFTLSRNIQFTQSVSGGNTEYMVKVGDEFSESEKYDVQKVMTNDRLTGVIVSGRKGPIYYLYYQYDSKGRITSERWERLVGGKRVLWMNVENRFYSNDPDQWPVLKRVPQ